MSAKTKGIICAVISSLLFSMGGLFVKLTPWSPLAINGGRCIFATLVMGSFALIIKHKFKFNLHILSGALSVFLMTLTFTLATKHTTAANAIMLQYIGPVFVILFMWMVYRQRPGKVDVLFCVLIISGILCFFLESLSAGGMLGNLFAILSGILYAIMMTLTASPKYDTLSALVLGLAISALVGSPFIALETDFSARALLIVVVLGVFQLGLAYVFFTLATRHTPPTAMALLSCLEPVMNPVLVAIFYGEAMGWLSIIGAVIVVSSIALYGVLKARRPVNAAQPA